MPLSKIEKRNAAKSAAEAQKAKRKSDRSAKSAPVIVKKAKKR